MEQESARPVRQAAGGVVYRYEAPGQPLILLIHDKYGFWTLPKGHLHAGESEEAAAVREVREETGVTAELGPLIARTEYTILKHGLPRAKQVAFFLMRAADHTVIPQADEGISAAGWFAPSAALELIGYPQVRQVLAQALSTLPAE